MEQQQVTLADGSTQSVLVPKVYVRAKQGAIRGDGSFIAAERVNLRLTGDLDNQGLISAQKTLNITANNINNTNGGRLSAADARLNAENKITNVGGSISADNTLGLKAKSVKNTSTTFTTNNQLGASSATRTGIDQIGSIRVGDGLRGQVDADDKALTTLAISATNDVTFNAGVLNNQGGKTQIVSQEGDVVFNAIKTGNEVRAIGDANNYYIDGQTQDVGSRVTSDGDLDITAKNVSGTAATLTSDGGNTSIYAENDVTFVEGRATQSFSTANKMTSSGFLSKKTTQDRFDSQRDSAISSNIEGDKIIVKAGQDINFTGTNAISDRGTQLSAGRDVNILAAENTSSESTFSQTKKSGLFGADGGMGFTIGKQQTDDSNAKTALTHTASNIAAIDGNVIIDAGRTYQQTGSNLVAGMGADSSEDINDAPDNSSRGNVVVRAQDINVDNVTDVYTNQSEQKFKQSGFTVAVSNSLIDSAKGIDSLVTAAGNTDSTRMKGMAGVAAALKIRGLAKKNDDGISQLGALKNGNLKEAGTTRIQATWGTSKSQSNNSSYTEVNQSSSITTNNLALIATGAGTDSNININGSNLTVSNDALFQADNDLNVNGVAQNSNTRSDNKSSSAAIGGFADTTGSAGITANASRAKGYANSDSTTYANSQINVGGTTILDIGNDLNIKGGVINTNRAQGTIGGNVNIESLQDTATYDSKQKNMGFSADIDIAGGGAGSSLSVNGGKTNVNADYKGVGEQSGLFTGDGGFDLAAKGKTTLIGGAITTTDAAVAAGRNNYTSLGGITTQDIENTTSYEGDAISVGLSVGKDKNPSMNGLGYGTDGDSDSSVTRAGITGIAGNSNITTDNREEYAGALENVFDANQVNEELGAQTQITQEFGKEAPKAVAEFSGNIETQLILDGDLEEAKKWADGGAYRVALHTLVGAISAGSVEGALASGTMAVSVPAVDKYLEKQGVDETTRDALLLGLSAAAGAVVGGDTASTATSFSQTQNNFLSHKDRKALNALLGKAKSNGRLSLSDSEKLVYLVQYDQVTNILLEEYRKNPSSLSSKDLKFLEVALNDLIRKGGYDAVAAKRLIKGGSAAGYTTDNFLNKPKVAGEVSKERGNFLKDPWNYLTYTRPAGMNEETYNKALTTTNINKQQEELSKYGGDAIYASPGGLGMALRGALAAKGMYDIGYGGAAIYDGKYKEGMVRVAGGALEIVPAAVNIPNINKSSNISNSKWDYLLGDNITRYVNSFKNKKFKPATVVSAVDTQTGKIVSISNGNIPSNIDPRLQSYVEKLGGAGIKTSCGNTVGKCAEFIAINELLIANPKLKIEQIRLSDTMRPRNNKRVERCDNCTYMFGDELK